MGTIIVAHENGYVNPWRMFQGSWMPDWLMARPDVTPTAKLVYARLMRYAGPRGVAWPLMETLAEQVGTSERHARRAVAELRELKLIETRKVRFGGGLTFRFLAHPWMLTDVEKDDTALDQSGQETPHNPAKDGRIEDANPAIYGRIIRPSMAGLEEAASDSNETTCEHFSGAEDNHMKRVNNINTIRSTAAKRLLDLSVTLCQTHGHPKFVVRGAAAMKALKRLISTYGEETAEWLVRAFYNDPPKWNRENGVLAPEHIPQAAQKLLMRRPTEPAYDIRDVTRPDGTRVRQFLQHGKVVEEIVR